MKATDFLSLLGFIVLFVNAWFERVGRALPEGIKAEWLTWAGLALIVIGVAARTVLIAIMANTLTKTAMAVSIGAPELRKRILPISALLIVAGVGAALIVG